MLILEQLGLGWVLQKAVGRVLRPELLVAGMQVLKSFPVAWEILQLRAKGHGVQSHD